MKMYAIKNCNTVQKARDYLESKAVEYDFHDYKKLGVEEDKLREWIAEFGWENIMKRKGMMWNKLDPQVKENLDEEKAVELMLENQSRIVRPILELDDGSKLLAFSEDEYASKF